MIVLLLSVHIFTSSTTRGNWKLIGFDRIDRVLQERHSWIVQVNKISVFESNLNTFSLEKKRSYKVNFDIKKKNIDAA